MKICTVDYCGKPHRAKGLCSAHYNQQRYTPEQRHKKHVATCETCGEPFETERGRFCSLLCRDLWRIEQGDPMGAAHAARAAAQTYCSVPADHPVRWMGTTCAIEYRTCLWCGAAYCTYPTSPRYYCTLRCKASAKRVRRRGREAEQFGIWTWSDFMRMARRFDYRCAYCGTRPNTLDPDHVIPVSRGGMNTLANLLPSCRPCNSDKRDLLLDEWLHDRARRGLPPRTTSWAVEDRRFCHLTSITAHAA